MRRLLLTLLAAVSLLAACDFTLPGVPADPAGPRVVYEVADPAAVAATVELLDRRLQEAGIGRAEADPDEPRRVLCKFVRSISALDVENLGVRLIGRGDLEFRILAPEALNSAEREKCRLFRDAYKPPAGLRLLDALDGSRMLVEIPEDAALRALREAEEAGLPPDQLAELRRDVEDVRAREVFGRDDLDAVEPRAQQDENVLYFSLVQSRRAAFAEFTRRNVKRQLAIVIDGVVQSAPVIQSVLPGEGVISGGGPGGFTDAELAVLRVVLREPAEFPAAIELVDVLDPPGGLPEDD